MLDLWACSLKASKQFVHSRSTTLVSVQVTSHQLAQLSSPSSQECGNSYTWCTVYTVPTQGLCCTTTKPELASRKAAAANLVVAPAWQPTPSTTKHQCGTRAPPPLPTLQPTTHTMLLRQLPVPSHQPVSHSLPTLPTDAAAMAVTAPSLPLNPLKSWLRSHSSSCCYCCDPPSPAAAIAIAVTRPLPSGSTFRADAPAATAATAAHHLLLPSS